MNIEHLVQRSLSEAGSNVQHRPPLRRTQTGMLNGKRLGNRLRETWKWLKLIQSAPLIKKPELLNDILEETEEGYARSD